MQRIVTWFAMAAGGFVALAVAFALYTHFLVDYSLEDLEFALSATEQKTDTLSPTGTRIYKRLVQELAIEEAADEDANLKNLAFLEVAARSLGETEDRAGSARAKAYLQSATESKKSDRNKWLLLLDKTYKHLKVWYERLLSLFRYAKKQVIEEESEEVEISSYLLISQAEEQERIWELAKAEDLYRRFITFYPDHVDHSFVVIALSHVLMKQQKYHEAEELLKDLFKQSAGLDESRIAASLLRKINEFKKTEPERIRLEQEVLDEDDPQKLYALKLRLGLMYLENYNLKAAQKNFRELELAKDKIYRIKAKFYLGLIYKMQAQYDQGAEMLLGLSSEESLNEDIKLGTKAQLADVYYQSDNHEASLGLYSDLAESAGSSGGDASSGWDTLALSEQANIYYFDLNDPGRAQELLKSIEAKGAYMEDLTDMKKSLEAASKIDLRDMGFLKLRQGQPYEAMKLFKKKVSRDDTDAWAYSGLANSYVLLMDLYQADIYARKAYEMQVDEFTSSVYAYTLGYQNRYNAAVKLYKTALAIDADYIPAKYNLAGLYLLKEEYDLALGLLESLESLFGEYSNLLKAKILNNLGYAHWGLGDRNRAIELFEESLDTKPNFEDAQLNLGNIRRGDNPLKASLAYQ